MESERPIVPRFLTEHCFLTIQFWHVGCKTHVSFTPPAPLAPLLIKWYLSKVYTRTHTHPYRPTLWLGGGGSITPSTCFESSHSVTPIAALDGSGSKGHVNGSCTLTFRGQPPSVSVVESTLGS
ncbi:hypothetical protein VNO77_20176 [Canavalia gladiata]|uniref:Uncharacterized protein n=1 Tax=Canavalia gladiata TaxID=3824 RepID=A0AAN9LNT0_CANGL